MVATLFVSAQSFNLSTRSIAVSGPASGSVDLIIHITNTSASDADSMFKWTVLTYNAPSAWELAFCDPNDCYFGLSASQNKNFKLKKGMGGEFKATFTFNNTSGTDTMRVALQSLATFASDTMTFVPSTWLTGIKEASRNREISFYPNPAKDQLTFNYASNGPLTVNIYNVLGAQVKSFVHDGAVSHVNISDLQNGMYFIRVKDGSKTYSKSFTKSE